MPIAELLQLFSNCCNEPRPRRAALDDKSGFRRRKREPECNTALFQEAVSLSCFAPPHSEKQEQARKRERRVLSFVLSADPSKSLSSRASGAPPDTTAPSEFQKPLVHRRERCSSERFAYRVRR